jgi:hypothetical protein
VSDQARERETLERGQRGGAGRGAIELEVFGIAVFVALAVAGWFRSPWFLVIGIAGHGVAWDLWHHGALVVPSWYALGCLVADLALAAYAATQVPAYRAAQRRVSMYALRRSS